MGCRIVPCLSLLIVRKKSVEDTGSTLKRKPEKKNSLMKTVQIYDVFENRCHTHFKRLNITFDIFLYKFIKFIR